MATDTPTILIVEDEPDLANLYTVWLGDEYDTKTASNGSEALELIDESVDVVLLDRRMPELSGDAVLETIGEREVDCRVAMVTAVEPDFDIVDMGFDDYLVKPVSKDELLQAVERLEVRTTYDEELREFCTLAEKKALLDTEKATAELVESEEYARLEDRLAGSRVQLSDVVADAIEANELEADDDGALSRELNAATGGDVGDGTTTEGGVDDGTTTEGNVGDEVMTEDSGDDGSVTDDRSSEAAEPTDT
ncbi:receiver box response regulator [Natrialba magadii ATCC 43099]|uniref:Receiver box response regulator n=1 Tax=Natrialba magadii (strain ATCC 43099 / DSM 3394 / CCM 3739 / CIP 104546 / IAM 13178 / JCM 8861 / NBRC 102185 / NCIMB 2190 / MS3) TaxID=547559 RepID=D3STZ7_NATMM|nr:receiver box response regulator [Natrialba magadii ATCC 43099]ELY28771.1 response regulator receiver protein [Natrialba magadii ATCC 43099]